MEVSMNSAYLFKGMDRGLSFMEEETYILNALNTFGIRYSPNEEANVDDLAYISRWPEHKFPLKIYVEPELGSTFTPLEIQDLMHIVQKGLYLIEDINPNVFKFQQINASRDADIIFHYRRTERHQQSHCFPEIGAERQLKRAEVCLNVPENYTPEWILVDVVHNMLHGMGIFGHSPHPRDCATEDYQYAMQLLTYRDIKTLDLLYRCPIAMTRKELMLLWGDYQDKFLSLPMNSAVEGMIPAMDHRDPVLNYMTTGILVKTPDLSQREVALQEMFSRYIQKLQMA